MSPLSRLWAYVRPYRRAFYGGLVCVLVTQAVALSAPVVLQRAIDDLAVGLSGTKLTFYGGLLLAIHTRTGTTTCLHDFSKPLLTFDLDRPRRRLVACEEEGMVVVASL